jgi:hypothetical protein
MFLKEITVPIPEIAGKIVLRNGRTVEYETERVYQKKTRDTRVKRKVIGRVHPYLPGIMYPNEAYFQLIPNDVPAEIRDRFLARCARRREMNRLKRNPEEMMKKVQEGLEKMTKIGAAIAGENDGGTGEKETRWYVKNQRDLDYLIDLFGTLYDQIEVYAQKEPNAVVQPFKVAMLNRILRELKEVLPDLEVIQCLSMIEMPEVSEDEDGKGKKELSGLSYSDVLMHLSWYREALP